MYRYLCENVGFTVKSCQKINGQVKQRYLKILLKQNNKVFELQHFPPLNSMMTFLTCTAISLELIFKIKVSN